MALLAHARPLPRGAKVALLVLFVLLIPLPIAIGALDTGDMRCVRAEAGVHCEYVESLLGVERGRRRFEDVTGARLDHSRGKNGSGTYRTVLQTREGELPLSRGFNYNRERSATLVEAVSRFVAGTHPTMQLSQGGWGWAMVLGFAALWLSLAWLLPRLHTGERTA